MGRTTMAYTDILARMSARMTDLRRNKEDNDAAWDQVKTWRSEADRVLRGPPQPGFDHLMLRMQQQDQDCQIVHDTIISTMDRVRDIATQTLFRVTTPEEMPTLLSLGADVQYRQEGLVWGTAPTALQFFAREGLHELVDILLANIAEVDALDGGFTPLWIACHAGDEKMNVVRSLLRGGANEELLEGFFPAPMSWNNRNDGIRRIVRRASRLRRLAWLAILRMRGCELNIAVRLSSRLPASRTARAVIFLVNVAPDGVFG
ncbi:unnamed protein product [Ectocarpus sp. 12 AP-2014]